MAEYPDRSTKKRRRPAKSCEPCRARKVKCDQADPCSQCTKSRASLKCIYAPETIRNRSPEPSADITTEVGAPCVGHEAPFSALQERLTRLEAIFTNDGRAEKRSRDLDSLDLRIKEIEKRLNTGHTTQCTSSGISVKPLDPSLRHVPGKTKLFPRNHWIHTAKQLATMSVDSSVELNYDSPKVDFAKTKEEVSRLRAGIKAYQTPVLNEPVPNLRDTIPRRELCDELSDMYLATFELIYRTVSIPTFHQEYTQFWSNPSSAPTLFILKLVLMLATATTLHPETNERHHLYLMSKKWIYAAQWWLMGPAEKSTSTIDCIQIACLLQIARQMTGLGRAWATSGYLLQLAFSMGLHRDPDNFPNVSSRQGEMRRRLWVTVLELTLLAANDTPVPVMLQHEEYDTKPPQCMSDEALSEEVSIQSTEPSGTCSFDAALQRLLYDSFVDRVRANRLALRTAKEQCYEETVEVANNLKNACRKVAKYFSTANYEAQDASRFHYSQFQHQFLDMQLRRYILALHKPFVTCKRHDPTFYLSRTVCLDSVLVMESYGKASSNEGLDASLFNPFCQRTAGCLMGPLSLDVITILALELMSQLESNPRLPNDPEEEMSKKSRDRIFDALASIADRLRERIDAGGPRLKAYGLTMTIISQFRAMERGENPQLAIGKAIFDQMDGLRSSLQKTLDTLSQSEIQGVTAQADFNLNTNIDFTQDFDFDMYGTFPFLAWGDNSAGVF